MKKFIGLSLAFIIALSSMGVVFGEDKGLSEAIIAAKSYVSVPSDKNKLDYEIYKNEKGTNYFVLNWHNDDSNFTVTVDEDGCLIEYSVYDDRDEEITDAFARFTPVETEKKADEFLKVAYGENAVKFKLKDKDIDRYSHRYSYVLMVDDIEVSNGDVSISVNSDKGVVTNFTGVGKEFFRVKYPSKNEVKIDENKAMKLYFDDKYPEPVYKVYRDYKDKKPEKKTFLAFEIYSKTKSINAITGEVSTVQEYFDLQNAKMMSDEAAASTETAAMNAGGFTEEEMQAIEVASNFITSDEASKIIKNAFPKAKSLDYSRYRYAKNDNDDYYIYLNTDSYNSRATLDAKTGKIISFRCIDKYVEPRADEKEIQEPTEKTKNDYIAHAKGLVEKLATAESKKINDGNISFTSYNGTSEVYFDRIENGYKCQYNGISVVYNKDGEVISYNNTFDNKLKFNRVSNVYKEEDALKALDKVFNFELTYSVDNNYKATLLYHFADNGRMSPDSTTKLDYTGKPIESVSKIGIDDVYGHWCEPYVTKLYNNGFKIEDTHFRPDKLITYDEMASFFKSYGYKPYYINNGKTKKENNNVTRYEIAEFVMESYNLDKLKNYPEIFNITAYKDEIDKEYISAVAIVTGMGIMQGNNEDMFNGSKYVTRAEAAVVLYNMLNTK